MMAELVWVVVALALVGGVVWSFVQKQKRRESFATFGMRFGLQYYPQDPFGLLGLPFDLLRMGDRRGIENVLAGPWQGLDVKAFDYWYEDRSTDAQGHTTSTRSRFSCAVAPIGAVCSHLTVRPEGVFGTLANAVGFHDIRFESEEFNRAWHVTSNDPKFANDIVDARMMRWLLAGAGGWSFEVFDAWVLCYRHQVGASELIPLVGTLKGFLDHVPRVVYGLYPVEATAGD